MERQQRGVDLDGEILATPESAADTPQMDAHLVGLEPETRRDLVTIDVQPLRGDVDVDAPRAVRDGETRLRAEKRLILDPHLVHARHAHVTGRVRVAVADHDRAHDVRPVVVAVAMPHRGPVGMQRRLLGGALHLVDGFELLVLDHDRLRGTPRLLRMLCRNEGHRLAVVAHAVDRQHRLVGKLEPERRPPRTSACVSTPCTPLRASAGVMSIETMRACACGLRSVWPHSIPAACRSDEYANSPRTLGGASGRVADSPTRPSVTRVTVSVVVTVGTLSVRSRFP